MAGQQRHGRSPMDLRDDGPEGDILEPYQPPRALTRQAKIYGVPDTIEAASQMPPRAPQQANSHDQQQQHSTGAVANTSQGGRRTWFSRLSSGSGGSSSKGRQDFRERLTKRIARLSSLDSTRSSSSLEDASYNQSNSQRQLQQHATMPLISITNNDNPAVEVAPAAATNQPGDARRDIAAAAAVAATTRELSNGPISSASQRRADYYRDYYGRSSYNKSRTRSPAGAATSGSSHYAISHARHKTREIEEDDDDEEDDAFEDAPLPVPYSSSSMARSVVVRQQTERGISYPSGLSQRKLAELLDDRQGMNSGEQQFTKAEKQANRPSIDEGSIISGSDYAGKAHARGLPPSPLLKSASGSGSSVRGKSSGGGKLAKLARLATTRGGGSGGGTGSSRRDKRRSKSPSSVYRSQRRQSRRGFLGLASRLKLTKKHESIAKLQLSILNSGFVSLKTLDRDLQSFLPRERLSLRDFQERVKLMRKFEVLSTIEYRFASKYETYVCKHAQTELNQPKNNYKKCIPYDYNRIVLKTLPEVPDSDYINASHVDSCLKPNAYIAAQGPNEFTIEDFWRMIWEQKTFVIVMLTKVFDFIRVMCNQYWPVELNKPERYGSIEVTLLYEEPLADFVIRTIKISKLKGAAAAAASASASASATATATAAAASSQGTHNGSASKQTQNAMTGESEDEFLSNKNILDNTSASDSQFEDEDEEDFDSQDEVIDLNDQFETPISNGSLGVRAPRFVVSAGSRRSRERSLTPGGGGTRESRRMPMRRTNSQGDLSARLTSEHNRTSSATGNKNPQSSRERPQPPNEFLHPLFNARYKGSSNSIGSEPPGTPLTPRTPSSAGLDRSSATRKAVKKKRREPRAKNQRPRRTQFLVPTESQLQDDDEEDEEDEDNGLYDLDDDQDNNQGRNFDDRKTDKSRSNGGGGGGGKTNERIIYQFHYNSWASHTCPFISSLLHFRRRVRICMDEMSKSGRTGPTVVHCNDGCGRTGAYLCIDANLELAEEDSVLDIYNYTRKMRQSRKYLIENLEQYKFVYDTIEEAIYCGKTWFPVSELHKRLKHKSQRNAITRKNEYLLEYEKICRMTSKFSIGDCAGGHRVENREKNRDVSTVPPDNFRPYLSSFQTNDSTDYVNAVFVDGYTRSKEYIVTEWPLHKTISDFWSLVYDHDCNSVILLANPGESSTYPSFLPSEKELRRKFGPVFSAEMVSYTHYQNIKSWIYTINKKIVSLTEVIAGVKSEAKTTQVFQITCWPQGHRVPTSTNALVELMNMVERWRQRTTYGPVCVVSLNGKSRAGVYCAANVAIEQVVQHSEVDVFNAVKTVRRHRPQLIENMTEYKYCYDLILHYVLHYVNNQSTSAN